MNAPAAILARYPQLPHSGQVITRLPAGTNTAPWLISTTHGRYVLRRLPEYFTPERARFTAAAHDHAARTSGLAPAVLSNNDGHLTTEHGTHHYLLTRHAAGNHPHTDAATPSQCHDLGTVLGRIHQHLRELPVPATAPRQAIPADPTAGIRAAAAAHAGPDCSHRHARRLLAAKLRRAQALTTADLDELRSLPQALIHGDFHPGNVLVLDDNRISAVLDFDLARLAPPAYELLRALLYCTQPAGPPTVYAPRVIAFLTGYLDVAPLSHRELTTMTALYETTQLLDTYGLAVCDSAPPALLSFGHARFALLYWLRRNARTLTGLALQAHHHPTASKGTR
ncbi:phosphotransferase [Streptomyces anulatus]|uniref:phosphotransferase n=1 Tax=Streptomyces anulatus TaxID=1892 RepID=UPI0004CB127F|nr:phosphotransferase [Streptomyces anulatus]